METGGAVGGLCCGDDAGGGKAVASTAASGCSIQDLRRHVLRLHMYGTQFGVKLSGPVSSRSALVASGNRWKEELSLLL